VPLSLALVWAVIANAAGAESFAARAERAFSEAQRQVQREPGKLGALIDLSSAAFHFAEFARDNTQRAAIATQGIDSAREAIYLSTNSAAAHYWLAMNFGQLARTKMLGALQLVRRMEEEFLTARRLDERVDYAGPDRSLGLLYREAPGWPTSIGNKRKAREHLERAVRVAPEFPDNQLALVETFLQWGDRPSAAAQFKALEECLENAKTRFTGEEWAQSWDDWNKRFAVVKAALGRSTTTPGKRVD
jgi:tetratricopeptide (TPR) repeat protein